MVEGRFHKSGYQVCKACKREQQRELMLRRKAERVTVERRAGVYVIPDKWVLEESEHSPPCQRCSETAYWCICDLSA